MSGEDVTNVNVLGLLITATLCGMTLFLPRKYCLLPLFLGGCYITLGQVMTITGFHFTMLRIILLFGWIRLIVRKEIRIKGWNIIDKSVLLWVFSSTVIYLIQYQNGAALTNRLGFIYNVLGIYFFCRCSIDNISDVVRIIRFLAVIIVPLAFFMLIERLSGKNYFSIFGGVMAESYEREGAIRCQGPFQHPILAGTFGATLVPLFLSLWKGGKRERFLSAVGVAAATVITVAAASSGALMTYMFAIAGMVGWHFRKHMTLIRWSAVMALFALNLVMKAPVWYLFARLSSLVGGTGDHRAMLIDAAIKHFKEWYLVGTHYTADWMPYTLEKNPDMIDITNQYLYEGINFGLITMIVFIGIIVVCHKEIGSALKAFKNMDLAIQIMLWGMGVSLFCHAVSFMSVAYTDQIAVYWYLLLAIIATVSDHKTLRGWRVPC